MPTEGESQVLIVGAGPAGCAAGIALARAGLDVTIVDRAHFPRDKTCGDAVSNLAMELIDELGAGEAVRDGPHALVRSGVAVFPDGARISRFYDRPGFIVPRISLDDALKRAAGAAGANLIEGQHVGRLTRGPDGHVSGAEGADFRWRTRAVIAADGYGSVGHALLGRPRPRGRYLGVSSTAYYRGLGQPFGRDLAEHFFEHDLPFGYAWIFPPVRGLANIGIYLRQDAYSVQKVALSELLEAFIARHRARFGPAEQVGPVRTWSLPIGPCPWPAAGHGVLLAGDAGGFIDPLSGEGIWQALFTGLSAGQIAARALHAGAGLDDAACAEYERVCAQYLRRHHRAKAGVASAMRWVLRSRLYRTEPLRAALRWAYQRKSFEITKA